MSNFEEHGWQGMWVPGRKLSGNYGITVLVKRRFEVDMMEALCLPAPTGPVTIQAEPYEDGELPVVSIRHPMEFSLEKRKVDLIVRGTAYAPGGKPVPEFDVEMRIPNLISRKLRIFGNRHLIWYPPVKWLTPEEVAKGEPWIWPDPDFSEPEPIDKLPLRYEYAFGGIAKIKFTDDVEAMKDEAHEIAEVQEERRERKKEIIEELKKKEEDKKKKKEKKPVKGDEKAAELAAQAFGDDGGEQKLDEETAKRLAEADAADDGMRVVSAYRLGKDMPETVEEADRLKAEAEAAKAEAEGGDKKDGAEEPEEEDPNAQFFTTGDKTQMLDVSKLDELEDEFKDELDERALEEARKLKDDEGTLRDRATEFGDLKLHDDDNWAAKYMNYRPKKKKRKLEETEEPTIPYPANMCGKGFCVSHVEEVVEDLPLPNIEDPDDLLDPDDYIIDITEFDLNNLRTPAGWGAYWMGSYPRAGYWGAYPWDLDAAKEMAEKTKEEFDEDDPDDKPIIEAIEKNKENIPVMNPLAFQEAHPKLQVDEVRGDEDVYFTNMTPEGSLYFKLPGIHPTVTIDLSEGPEPLSMRIDSVLFDLEEPEKPAVEMVWRGWYKLKSLEELEVKPFRKISIIEVDQDSWLEIKRKERVKKRGITDGDLDEDEFDEKDLEEKYKAQFKRKRGGKGERYDDVHDAIIFDQDDDRQVLHDEWDQEIRDEKQAFIDEQKAKAEAEAKLKEKALKAEAREQADEEFGIIRDPETGEVLAVEPPEKD